MAVPQDHDVLARRGARRESAIRRLSVLTVTTMSATLLAKASAGQEDLCTFDSGWASRR